MTDELRVCYANKHRPGEGMHGLCCTSTHLLGTVCPVDEACEDDRCLVKE